MAQLMLDFQPWRFLPAELAHRIAPLGLSLYDQLYGGKTPQWQPFHWRGLEFPNRLGLAGGMDKNGEHLQSWQNLGAGFLEVGTVTPRAQKANPGKIMDRDWSKRWVWNKMGFPNHGVEELYYNLLHFEERRNIPVFVNIGKNRDTPNAMAFTDYAACAQRMAPLASAFVVNVSSPNTQDLRELQEKRELSELLKNVLQASENKPVLVKLSPDLSDEQLKHALETVVESGAHGVSLSNTTKSRPQGSSFPIEGGLSGACLQDIAKNRLQKAYDFLGGAKKSILLISVGGIFNSRDVQERLAMGADLLQVYSALVFEGPRLFQKIAAEMESR